MTNETTQTEAQKKDRAVLLDEKIAEVREDLAKTQAKLERLLTEKRNRDRLQNIEVGTEVSFEYGRGDKRRTMTGKVVATGNDEKLGLMLAVQTGEGLDVQTVKIRAADVLLDGESAEQAGE